MSNERNDRIGGLNWNIQRAINEDPEIQDIYDRVDVEALVQLLGRVPMAMVIDAENLAALMRAMKVKGHTNVWCNIYIKPGKNPDTFYGFVNPPKGYVQENTENDAPF